MCSLAFPGQAKGGQAKGGQAKGGQAKGGQAKGGQAQGGQAKGSQAQGGQRCAAERQAHLPERGGPTAGRNALPAFCARRSTESEHTPPPPRSPPAYRPCFYFIHLVARIATGVCGPARRPETCQLDQSERGRCFLPGSVECVRHIVIM